MSKKKEEKSAAHPAEFYVDLALSVLSRCRPLITASMWSELQQQLAQASYYLSEAGFQVDKEKLLREHEERMKKHPGKAAPPEPPKA